MCVRVCLCACVYVCKCVCVNVCVLGETLSLNHFYFSKELSGDSRWTTAHCRGWNIVILVIGPTM